MEYQQIAEILNDLSTINRERAKAYEEASFLNFIFNLELRGGFIKWKGDGKPVEGMSDTKPMTMEAYTAEVSAGIVLVDIGAPWCAPCHKMDQVLQLLHRDMEGKYKLVKIDAGVHTDLMKQLKATELPTLILYQNGKEVWRKAGLVELEELEKEINR